MPAILIHQEKENIFYFLENNPGFLSEEQRNELPFILSSFCDFCQPFAMFP